MSLDSKVYFLYTETMAEGCAFEAEAERCRMEAEQAFRDVGDMKAEGRRRAGSELGRMLPKHERAVDVRTNTMKAMGDAKGDQAFYTGQAVMYANLAAMKFAKAAALLARLTAGRQ